MRTLHLFLVFAVIAFSTMPLHAQDPPVVKARTFGVSGYLAGLDSTDGIDVQSNGLPNVAPGSKVYMGVYGTYSDDGESWASSTFSLILTPSGSTASISMLDALRASFVADLEGTYMVEVTGTDDQSQSDTDTLTINVAKYVGVGGLVEAAKFPECSLCHGGINDTWKGTAHAVATSRNLDDPDGHIQSFCLRCHTTGSTDGNAEGDGFVHLAKSSSWTFPTELKAGNWDAMKAEDAQLAARANVQCESCHGPGSEHGGTVTDNKMVTTLNSEQCLQCHDAPGHHIKPNEWRDSKHFTSVGDPTNPEHMNRGSQSNIYSDCARCHTANGFIDVFIKSQDPPAQSYSNAPYEEPSAVGCATCHDPHDATNEHQLRLEIKDLCASCHSIRVSGYSGLHHSHQGPMLKGEDGKEFPGYNYPNSAHTSISEQCVQCHMAAPEDPTKEFLYGGHTFHVTYDNGTPDDESDDLLNSTGCVSCHVGGIGIDKVEDTQTEIKGLLDDLKGRLKLRSNGNPLNPTDTSLTQIEKDIHWNWYFVANDNSFGVHNHDYAKALLESSIAEHIKLTTAIEPIDNSIPGSFVLSQNFPNPFNPSTSIQFSIPNGTHVDLSVYDATGQKISVLVNGYYQPGTYQVSWNGTTITDTRFAPSGLYFYRIVTNDNVASRKMLLMK
jgi:predicted CXXCH cytochrome family protein